MQKPHTDWSNRRYLIVEGDEKFRAWSEGVLRKVGAVNVHCAASCNDGLVQQEKLHADVVLIDFQLSDLHPVDFMRRIRKLQQKGDAETLIIPVATAADAAVLRQACLVGIQSFIRKPTDADNFLKRVNGALSNPRRFVFGRQYFGPERRLSQTDYDGADRRIPDAQPAAAPRSIPAAKLSQATGKTKPAQAGEKVKPPQTTGAAKPTARVAEKKATTLAPPIEPPRSQKPTGDDEPLVPVDDGEITLIEDVDVVGIVDKLSPEVNWRSKVTWIGCERGGQEGERASLQGSDLHGAELGRINLSSVNLREADLSDSDCTGTNFQGADLRQANLSRADISDGNLGVAKMRHSTLKNTRLDGANMRGADSPGRQCPDQPRIAD